MKGNLVAEIQTAIRKNWDMPALSDYEGISYTYSQVGEKILMLHEIFKKSHLHKEDKVALLGKNSVNWGIVYLATVAYGATIVPILPDFHTDDVHHIVNHSDSKLFFISESLFEKVDEAKMPELDGIITLEHFRPEFSRKKSLHHAFEKISESRDEPAYLPYEDFQLPEISSDTLGALVYTSGTTGFSKGVMLSQRSLYANVIYAQNHMPLKPGNRILSFLPLAHAYGCAFEFLFPFTMGAHITFLNRVPNPKILINAFGKIRPHLILAVPLILEKIYKKQIKTVLESVKVKVLSMIPPLKKLIYKKIREKLFSVFGGNFFELVIGGAPLNQEAEKFLKKIKFPFTVGYGMTECGPLISYASWRENPGGAVGRVVDTLEIKVDSENPREIVGEILVRGENVMDGYYKNKEETEKTFEKGGWMHTGDLGIIDSDGFVYIKGRSKNLILGPAGENIYPEGIEAKLNNMPYIQESLVVEKNGRLAALVYPDMEMVDSHGLKQEDIREKMEENRKELNKKLPSYSSIVSVELYPEEFEKTPTRKIKRFLYTRGFSS
jgi:long-chain acyl-CoA synthetase